MKWHFTPYPADLVETEVTQRDQFNNDDVDLAETIVREAAQNSLSDSSGTGASNSALPSAPEATCETATPPVRATTASQRGSGGCASIASTDEGFRGSPPMSEIQLSVTARPSSTPSSASHSR